jgi:hypothetical protein
MLESTQKYEKISKACKNMLFYFFPALMPSITAVLNP